MGSVKAFDANFIRSEVDQKDNTVYVFDAEDHGKRLLQNLYQMQRAGIGNLDVTITCQDGEQTSFHGFLLAAMSPKLEEFITAKYCSKSSDETDETDGIDIEEELFSDDVIKSLRDYVYTSKVAVFDAKNSSSLKKLADKYGLEVCCGPTAADVLSKLQAMYRSGKLCDAKLQGQEEFVEISCHGKVLAAMSSEFCDLLSSAEGDGAGTILSLEYPVQVLGILMNYLYTAELHVSQDTVEALLEIAATYNIPSIANACCNWLEEEIGVDNVLGIMSLVRLTCKQISLTRTIEEETDSNDACAELLKVAPTFILDHFMEICDGDEMVELTADEMIALISDDQLQVGEEEDVYRAVMKWFEWDKEARIAELPSLLRQVRLETTSLEFLHDIKQELGDDEACLGVVDEALEILQRTSSPSHGNRKDEYKYDSRDGETYSQGFDDPTFDVESTLPPESYYSDMVGEDPQLPPPDLAIPDALLTGHRTKGVTKSGKPDMRVRSNREKYLQDGTNKDGTPDMRHRHNKKSMKTNDRGDETPTKGEEAKAKRDVARKLCYSPDERGVRRKDGRPDMRFKVNRGSGLLRKDGERDMRFNAIKKDQPLTKGGHLDMRFKANKDSSSKTQVCKDGCNPVRRFKVDKEVLAVGAHNASTPLRKDGSSPNVSQLGPLKNDGTPDMRFKKNKEALGSQSSLSSHGGSSQSVSSSRSSVPLKKDGTPDMRYSVNKVPSTPSTKKSSGSSHGSYSSGYSIGTASTTGFAAASGPIKKDGTPDMRYRANKEAPLSTALSGYAAGSSGSLNSSYGSLSSYAHAPPSYRSATPSSSTYSLGSSASSSGPTKRDGTPDMRYAANKAAYSSSYSSGSSYSGYSGSSSGSSRGYSGGSSGGSCSGPMKSDGTPDMRYAANRR